MIYIARTEWRMSARELHELPEWELGVLLGERARMSREAEKQRQGQGG